MGHPHHHATVATHTYIIIAKIATIIIIVVATVIIVTHFLNQFHPRVAPMNA